MKKMSYDKRKELSELLESWLGCYTEEVIQRVMNEKLEEIINNPMSMMMLRELKTREEKEKQKRKDSFYYMIMDMEDGNKVDDECNCIHNNCLEHSKSYRDILYDMYIG